MNNDNVKYIVVTGSMSGIGKGIITSSIGRLLTMHDHPVTAVKIDPYLNEDAGTMSPLEHGEVYILDDGGEVDLDLGNYERFIGNNLTRDQSITGGKIYKHVINKERRGDYLGSTVQTVPHVTDAIREWISHAAQSGLNSISNRSSSNNNNDVQSICMVEMGGTVGEMDSLQYLEALRQMQQSLGPSRFCLVHVSLVPQAHKDGEQKSKPTQQSVAELRSKGLYPNIIVCRSQEPLDESVRSKISFTCGIPLECVLGIRDLPNIYRVPLVLLEQGFCSVLQKQFALKLQIDPTLKEQWLRVASSYDSIYCTSTTSRTSTTNPAIGDIQEIRVGLVGKYIKTKDSYLSVVRAIEHASILLGVKATIVWIDAESLEKPEMKTSNDTLMSTLDAILVPGGFGERGVEGKIAAAAYALDHNIPYLGICLGLQVAVILVSRRHLLGYGNCTSEEFKTGRNQHFAVIHMPDISNTIKGGTMRLGNHTTAFKRDMSSRVATLYGWQEGDHQPGKIIMERHRHRYEVNPEVVQALERGGHMKFVAQDATTGQRQEIVEIPNHPFFVGVQFHPEMKSRPTQPSPVFIGFLAAATKDNTSFIRSNPVPKPKGDVQLVFAQ